MDYDKAIDAVEALKILHMAYEYNLVQCGENVRNGPVFLCNCCCEGMNAIKKFGYLTPIQTIDFLPEVIEESCIGCGKCAILSIQYSTREEDICSTL